MLNLKSITKLLFISSVLFLGVSCSEDEPVVEQENDDRFYIGRWNTEASNGASYNISISAILEGSVGENGLGSFNGPLFISNTWKPAFGSENDGTISFRVEGDSLFNFFYDDTIPGCTGTFSGNGYLSETGNYVIDIVGNDCDGSHSGTFTLRKPD